MGGCAAEMPGKTWDRAARAVLRGLLLLALLCIGQPLLARELVLLTWASEVSRRCTAVMVASSGMTLKSNS